MTPPERWLLYVGGTLHGTKELLPHNPDGLYTGSRGDYKRDGWFDVGDGKHVGVMVPREVLPQAGRPSPQQARELIYKGEKR